MFPRGHLRAAIRGYLPTPNDFNLLDVHSDREDRDFIVLVGAEGLPCDGCLLKFDVEFQEDRRRFLYYEEITATGEPTGRYREVVYIVPDP